MIRIAAGWIVAWLTMTANAEPMRSQRVVTVAMPGGAGVPGEIYGAGSRGVVLVAHGGNSSIVRWQPPARALAADGFRVLED